jgi:hypothetical protein
VSTNADPVRGGGIDAGGGHWSGRKKPVTVTGPLEGVGRKMKKKGPSWLLLLSLAGVTAGVAGLGEDIVCLCTRIEKFTRRSERRYEVEGGVEREMRKIGRSEREISGQ